MSDSLDRVEASRPA